MAIVEQTDATPSQRKSAKSTPASAPSSPRCGPHFFGWAPTTQQGSTSPTSRHLALRRPRPYTSHVDDSALVAGVNNRVSWPGDAGSAAGGGRSPAGRRHKSSTRLPPGSTSTSQSTATPSFAVPVIAGALSAVAVVVPPDRRRRRRPVHWCAPTVHASSIGDGAAVRPFTYLRPGTALGADGKLGAFVGVRNSTGTGKVPHDLRRRRRSAKPAASAPPACSSTATVRPNGAPPSVSHVRTRSDTMFVAPVTISDGAYTGAGTVNAGGCPPGALAVAGPAAPFIENWVQRKRPGSPAAQASKRAEMACQQPTQPPTLIRHREVTSRLPGDRPGGALRTIGNQFDPQGGQRVEPRLDR